MASPPAGPTRLEPQHAAVPTAARSESSGLPADLVRQSAVRLHALALLYSFTFFMAGYVPALLFDADRAFLFSSVIVWGPGIISIGIGLTVAVIARRPDISPATVGRLGFVFEVASCYGIAAAEYLQGTSANETTRSFGLSWVAVWTVLFTVVIPTAPRRALVAAAASVSSVPVILAITIAQGRTPFHPSPVQFFFWLIFPYALVVVLAYVGARVVHALGTEVKRARELGSYHLVERLGAGGMGEVWRASHRLLARPAAIKLIRPGLSAKAPAGTPADILRRFKSEAETIGRLQSPHTVHLFDFGVADDGAFYYVMELLDGLDADRFVRRFGPLPPARVIYLVRQICHSLSEAGTRGLVHRDVKPANIFLCRYGEDFDFVKVLDFGLVKALNDAEETTTAVVTRENVVQGTPAFMAPEQALGSRTLDPRADIYATGCVAYWLLTGQQVFAADSSIGVLVQHAHTSPAPPSTRIESPIPAALEDLILACLAKDPAARPSSARELGERLDGIPISDPWTDQAAARWWKRHLPEV